MQTNLYQLQNLGFNIMDLPGAVLGPNSTVTIPKKSLNSVPKGKAIAINLPNGQTAVSTKTTSNGAKATVCVGTTCTAPTGSTTPASTGTGTSTDTTTHVVTHIVSVKSTPTPAVTVTPTKTSSVTPTKTSSTTPAKAKTVVTYNGKQNPDTSITVKVATTQSDVNFTDDSWKVCYQDEGQNMIWKGF